MRSKLAYEAIVYSTASLSLRNTLKLVQNACLRLILRAFPLSPITSSLQALTCTLSHLNRCLIQAQRSIPERFMQFINQLLQNPRPTNTPTSLSVHISVNTAIDFSALPCKRIKLLPPPEPPSQRTFTRIL